MHVFAFMNISCICFFCTPTWVHTYRPPKPRFQTATVVLAHALACSSLEGQQDTTKKKRKTQKRRKQDEGKQQKEHSEKERMRTRVESSHHRQLVKATRGNWSCAPQGAKASSDESSDGRKGCNTTPLVAKRSKFRQ